MKPNKNVIEKVIKKKIQKIVGLEKNYWKVVNEQRKKINTFDDDFFNDFEKSFPKNASTLIYGCIDGVALIRHTAWSNKKSVQIQVENIRISRLAKNRFLIPLNDEKYVNFSSINMFGLGFGTDLKFINLTINNELHFDYLEIAIFPYSDEGELSDWEDAITDIKLSILGLNAGLQESEQKQKPTIIEKLEIIKSEFINLLENAIKEEELQVFLKKHPFIIQPFSKTYPKQKLGDDFITDFVFASTLDQGIKYTFVEIERVSMPIFTKKGEFSSDFKHAEKQTLDWEIWLEKNKGYLSNKLPGLETPNFTLIAGRSKDFLEENKAVLRAWNRRQQNMEFFTYDDILFKLNELITNLKEEE